MANNSNQLFPTSPDDENSGPVECMGQSFPNDSTRREHFRQLLREKIADPEFRNIDGFPIGEIEDIVELSDPPYYTACPNPFLRDFILTRPSNVDGATTDYDCEPFASDVNEGKQDPVCMAHTYHTKVPYRAIARYILHYTKPGDVVLDSFCGTGMTGVGAQLCASPDTAFKTQIEKEWKEKGEEVRWGTRYAVLNDLSPFATFVGRGFNSDLASNIFRSESRAMLAASEAELGWVYATESEGKQGKLQYALWSDSFFCECGQEVPFWAVDDTDDLPKATSQLTCPSCNATFAKRSAQRSTITFVDEILGVPITQNRQAISLIQAEFSNTLKKILASESDRSLVERIAQTPFSEYVPTQPMMFRDGDWGHMFRAGYHFGVSHAHHFWTKRNLLVLSDLFSRARLSPHPHEMLFVCTSFAVKTGTRMHSVGFKNGRINLAGQTYNTLQLTSLSAERNLYTVADGKVDDLTNAFALKKDLSSVRLTTGSATALTEIPDASIDYIFIDPPFGDNIIYCELSFLYECWLRAFTNVAEEAIVSSTYDKNLGRYQKLMQSAFAEAYRVLKPGRWMTVAFHNSKNSVWNAIQESLGMAGFVVADVRVLDKGQGTYKQMTTQGAVEKDLVISAYRPTKSLEEQFELDAGKEEGAWDFMDSHLRQLPVIVTQDKDGHLIPERQRQLLFDRMVAFHIQRSARVPLDAPLFYEGLQERYPERDSMYFLPEQVGEYDKKRLTLAKIEQLELFVCDESSAIQWLKVQLKAKPQTFSTIQPQFMREAASWNKNEVQLELEELLEQNFIMYEGVGDVPSQIHSYLSTNYSELRNKTKDDTSLKERAKNRWYVPDPRKEVDLEKIRSKALLKEFRVYLESKGKLRKVRSEALRAGFQDCYNKQDYETILSVGRRVKETVIHEDMALMLYFDNAMTLSGQ